LAAQVRPQEPQFRGSVWVLVQVPLQSCSPVGHMPPSSDWQRAFAQDWPAPHAWPQPPQFLASFERSTQLMPQALVGGGHWMAHIPAWQAGVLPVQAWPQVPQFCGSLDRFTQLLPQVDVGGRHWVVQVPIWQNGVVPLQTVPHVPQLLGSVPVLVQVPLHLCWPVGQGIWHMPAEQVCPEPQAWPQVPQFCGSVDRSTQLWPQAVFGLWHWVVQVLASQKGALAAQTLPHFPQFLGSRCVSTQTPEQSVSLAMVQPPPSTPPSPTGRQFQEPVPFILHSVPGGQ
jgi:hypothetical protein